MNSSPGITFGSPLENTLRIMFPVVTHVLVTKAIIIKPYGLLSPLPIPDSPWSSISVDFITQLPPSNTIHVHLCLRRPFLQDGNLCTHV